MPAPHEATGAGPPPGPAATPRRRLLGAALAALTVAAGVATLGGSAQAHPPPPPGEADPDRVRPPGVASGHDYFWDPATRDMIPAHDFVRVELGQTVTLYFRDNDTVRFSVCKSGNTLEACRKDKRLREQAGGTCGDAVRSERVPGAGAVLGHHHVISLCGGVYSLRGPRKLSGHTYATLAPTQGSIIAGHADGTARRGAIDVTGEALGVTEAEYCMTAYPHPCRRWARIDVVVEPPGWVDARVAGVDDTYRLELNWQSNRAVLKALHPDAGGDWNHPDNILETLCCISHRDHWSFDLRLPVMLGGEKTHSAGRDTVVFHDAVGAPLGERECLPLYCEQIVPKHPTVSGWDPGGSEDKIGVDVEMVGRNLHVTLWGNPTDRNGIQPGYGTSITPTITYCLAHWQQSCGASACAKATYRGAPNLQLEDWMTVVPSSLFVATTNCPAPARVRIDVRDTTPPGWDPAGFTAATPTAAPVTPEEGGPPAWEWRPDPDLFSPTSVAAEPHWWCFPGRFRGGAVGDLEGDAGRWVDDATTTAVSQARRTRFGRYMLGRDAAGNDLPEWDPLPARVFHPVTAVVVNRAELVAQLVEREYAALLLNPGEFPARDPTLGEVWRQAAVEVFNDFVGDFTNRFAAHWLVKHPDPATHPLPDPLPAPPADIDEFIRDYVDRNGQYYAGGTGSFDYRNARDVKVFDRYDVMFADEWDREPLWQGLLRSEYPGGREVLAQGASLVHPVDHRLVENQGAESTSCLGGGTTIQIVGAWGTYPGAPTWINNLCGTGLIPDRSGPLPVGPPRPPPFAWRNLDADCPADAPVPGDTRLPTIWLRDNPDDPDDPSDDPNSRYDDPYDPSLGDAWERALDAVTPCVDSAQCDAWAPPVPGYYRIRVRIERGRTNPFGPSGEPDSCPAEVAFGAPDPDSPDPSLTPECFYHHYLTDRTESQLVTLGWPTYWGPAHPTDPAADPPHFEFDDLIWVTDLRVDAVG